MAEIPLPGRDSIDAQADLFRRAAKECGLTMAVIAARSPLALSTLKGWSTGTAMPAWALGQLGEAGVPDHLLSLVFEPFSRSVVTDAEGDSDLSLLGREGAHFLAEKADAEQDGRVSHIETARLKQRAKRVALAATRFARRA